MARKRMFSAEVVNSDSFLDMPLSSQSLYFHLGVQADDDGFVSPNKVVRMIGANPDELKILKTKGFVIPFENGVIVIRHWHENNYIRSDRYSPTIYKNEFRQLRLDGTVYERYTAGIPNGSIGREVGRKVERERILQIGELSEEQKNQKMQEMRKNLQKNKILP